MTFILIDQALTFGVTRLARRPEELPEFVKGVTNDGPSESSRSETLTLGC
jgi:hypothetical protein